MAAGRRFASAVCVLCWWSFAGPAASADRLKRELGFPKGGSFVTAVALASTLPKGPTDGFVHVLEFDLGFPFPDKYAIGKAQTQKKRRRISSESGSKEKNIRFRGKRNIIAWQKQKLLLQIEDAITRGGFNGSSCVSRFQCELRHISPNTSLLEELLSAVFAPLRSDHGDCQQAHLHCPVSLLHVVLHSQQVSPGHGA